MPSLDNQGRCNDYPLWSTFKVKFLIWKCGTILFINIEDIV
nr:MAG TPA: hypothetical protein [Caudoviricetes sp.]